MAKQIIYSMAKQIGSIETGNGSNLYVYSANGTPVGYYHVSENTTYEVGGRVVGKGDLRVMLLRD